MWVNGYHMDGVLGCTKAAGRVPGKLTHRRKERTRGSERQMGKDWCSWSNMQGKPGPGA